MDTKAIRYDLANRLLNRSFVTDKTGVETIELTGTSFHANSPTVFGRLNLDWAERELIWYHSQSLSVEDIPEPVPEIWRKVAASDGTINSNYGFLIFSRENGFQYRHVVQELRDNPDSRRAVMVYQRPSIWSDYNTDGRSDFICTNAVQYLIRDGQLNAVCQMRSSDLIFGYKGDLHWQKHVLRKVAAEVGVEIGDITWQVGSAHVYRRHFYLIDHWIKTGEIDVKKSDYDRLYPDSEWT